MEEIKIEKSPEEISGIKHYSESDEHSEQNSPCGYDCIDSAEHRHNLSAAESKRPQDSDFPAALTNHERHKQTLHNNGYHKK